MNTVLAVWRDNIIGEVEHVFVCICLYTTVLLDFDNFILFSLLYFILKKCTCHNGFDLYLSLYSQNNFLQRNAHSSILPKLRSSQSPHGRMWKKKKCKHCNPSIEIQAYEMRSHDVLGYIRYINYKKFGQIIWSDF